MAQNNIELEHTIKSLIYYNTKYCLAICQPCGSVLSTNAAFHLRNFHAILSITERRAIIDYINTLDTQKSEDFYEEISFEKENDVIDGLSTSEVLQCRRCKLLGAESTIIKHCQNKHDWITRQGNFKNILC